MTKILKAFVLLSVAVIVFDYVLVVSKLKSRHAALWMLGEDVADDYALIRSILRRQRLPDVPKNFRLPDVVVAGAYKCGTRALMQAILHHPRTARACKAECHFFDANVDHGWSWYKKQIAKTQQNGAKSVSKHDLFVEKSSTYIFSPEAPQGIAKMGAKVILTLCNPVKRTLSEVVTAAGRRNLTMQESAELVVNEEGEVDGLSDVVVSSMYSRHLPGWLRHFEINSTLLVVNGDNLRMRPWKELSRVQNFLGLRRFLKRNNFAFNETTGYYCLVNKGQPPLRRVPTHYGGAGCLLGKKNPNRKASTFRHVFVEKLKEFFRPMKEEVNNLTGMDFSWAE